MSLAIKNTTGKMNVTMRIGALLLTILLLFTASGCGPEFSLNALFESKDVIVNDAVVGTWITSSATDGEVSQGQTYTFTKLGDTAYELIFPGDQPGSRYKSEVHLVHLGKFLFLDAYPAKSDSDEKQQTRAPEPFPMIGGHVFGRIWIDKDFLRIALLGDEWVKTMAEQKKLTAGSALVENQILLTASTEELQRLALQYAEDSKAFSEEIALCAPELRANDCSIAIFKQKVAANDPEAWDSLGQEYSKTGLDDEAFAAFTRAAQLDPSGGNDFHNYHYHIGRALLKRSQYEQARREFLEAHRLRPTDSTPDRQIGFSYFLESNFQEAVHTFDTDPWDVGCKTGNADCPARGQVAGGGQNLEIFATLALKHLGKQAEAMNALALYTRRENSFAQYRKDPEWEALLLSYEAGSTTESVLIGRAKTPQQEGEANFYVGYDYLLKGEKARACEYFQKTLETKLTDSDEYLVARARLTQLGLK